VTTSTPPRACPDGPGRTRSVFPASFLHSYTTIKKSRARSRLLNPKYIPFCATQQTSQCLTSTANTGWAPKHRYIFRGARRRPQLGMSATRVLCQVRFSPERREGRKQAAAFRARFLCLTRGRIGGIVRDVFGKELGTTILTLCSPCARVQLL
jgi:hypothetical protein